MSNEYLDIAMQKVIAQEVNKVLNDIKAEIKDYANDQWNEGEYISDYAVLEIIDKHIKEQK